MNTTYFFKRHVFQNTFSLALNLTCVVSKLDLSIEFITLNYFILKLLSKLRFFGALILRFLLFYKTGLSLAKDSSPLRIEESSLVSQSVKRFPDTLRCPIEWVSE